jgi:uncharacterized membrane protein YuzA (DUF378 family)
MPSIAPASLSARNLVFDRLDSQLRKYATPLTAVLSLVVGVSGSMMFFHLFKSKVQGLHEWLGMAFLLAFVLHGVRNRRPFVALFKQTRSYVLLGVAAVAAATFLLLAPPAKITMSKGLPQALLKAPMAALAPALGVKLETALSRVIAAGGAGATADSSIASLAASSHVDATTLLNAVLGAEK